MMEQAHKMGEAAHEMASTALDAIRSAHRQMHLISGAQPERCNPPLWARRALSRRCLPRPPPLFHHYGVRQGHRLSGRTALLRWCLQGGGGVRSLSTVTTVSARPLGLAGGEIPSIRGSVCPVVGGIAWLWLSVCLAGCLPVCACCYVYVCCGALCMSVRIYRISSGQSRQLALQIVDAGQAASSVPIFVIKQPLSLTHPVAG
mmetsp:Transcript_9993/g.28853  ORF Transcript_9993/g.28853 Transcript_9993/m.28853 type:complete len:203 (-) Transcript_9993:1296-1904(-)